MKNHLGNILILESEGDMLNIFLKAFSGFNTIGVKSTRSALKVMKQSHIDILIFDPTDIKDDLAELLGWISKPSRSGKSTRVFALCNFPYDKASLRVIDHPNIKIISLPLALADIVNAVQANLSLLIPSPQYGNDINQIIKDATEQMLGLYLEKNLVIDNIGIKEGYQMYGDNLVVIPICGARFLGTIAICMSWGFCLAVARGMIGDTEGNEVFSEVELQDVVKEISNQLSGLVQEKLLAKGFKVNIGMPRVTTGFNQRFVHPGRNQVAKIDLSLKNSRTFFERLFGNNRNTSTIEFCFDEVG